MRLAVPVPSALSETWNEWHLVFLSPWGRVGAALALCCAGLVFFFAWRALRGDRPRRRLILLSLRATGLLCALTLFFQPGVQLRHVTRVPNHIAVLVDSSASMNLSERAGDRSRAARAAATLTRASATLSGQVADLSVTKAADKSTAAVGDPVAYTVTVHNSGPSGATNVSVSDKLPAGLIGQSDRPRSDATRTIACTCSPEFAVIGD